MVSFFYEDQHKGKIIAGVDEVGRGTLAGPVVVAAVVINAEIFDGVNDSKTLSKKKREELYHRITNNYQHGIGEVSSEVIDEINILNATKLAVQKAVDNLSINPEVVLVDGNMKFSDERFMSIIKGDQLSYTIAAASIIAKVYRDNLMLKMAAEFPEYGWNKNAGYGTKAHREAIKKYGLTKYHRQSFCKNFVNVLS